MTNKKYIHYGSKNFIPERFEEITNYKDFVKPDGGLWASPLDAKKGWKDIVDLLFQENEYNIDDYFIFTLKEDSKVFHIFSVNDLDLLPKQKTEIQSSVCLDFESIKKSGYDAIELHLSEDRDGFCAFGNCLYNALYGWDCDSILIMNKDIIRITKEKEEVK